MLLKLSFLGASPAAVIRGEDPLPGIYNYFIGHDSSRWVSGATAWSRVRYEGLYPGIDLVLSLDGGQPKYDLIASQAADIPRVVIRCEGMKSLCIDQDGTLVLDADLGSITQARPPTFTLGASGAVRSVRCEYRILAEDRFGFVLGEHTTGGVTIDPGLVWSTYLGSAAVFGGVGDGATDVDVDGVGNVVVCGYAGWPGFPTTPGGYVNAPPNDSNLFVSRLDATASTLVFTSILGGSSNLENTTRIALGRDGTTTVVGATQSPDFPTTPQAMDSVRNAGYTSGFVFKLSELGDTLVYSTYLEGVPNGNILNDVSVTDSGAAIVGGISFGGTFPTTPGSFLPQSPGAHDGTVTRISPDGSHLEWSTFLGGPWADDVTALRLGPNEEVYLTGKAGVLFPTTPGAFQPTWQPSNPLETEQIYVACLGATGNSLLFSTYLGGSQDDFVSDIDIDSLGNVVISGGSLSLDYPTTPGTVQPVPPVLGTTWSGCAVVTKLNPTGTGLIFSSYLGSPGIGCTSTGVAVDASGVVTVVGETSSTFPTTLGAFDTSPNGNRDLWVARLNPLGTRREYSTLLGGPGDDISRQSGIALGRNRNVTVCGFTTGGFPTTPEVFDPIFNGGGRDALIARLDLLPQGVQRIGSSTDGCLGALALGATGSPQAGSSSFGLYCSGAPPSTVGWMLVSRHPPVARRIAGVGVWVDTTASYSRLPIVTDAAGYAEITLPLPPGTTGRDFVVQAAFPHTSPCTGPGPFAASDGLSITIQ
ncbi:MAG: hypothetical protein HZA53_09725 [Planctomycetes bacterium]|nr:hypothetical protein [Planctomycetota bacterium]